MNWMFWTKKIKNNLIKKSNPENWPHFSSEIGVIRPGLTQFGLIWASFLVYQIHHFSAWPTYEQRHPRSSTTPFFNSLAISPVLLTIQETRHKILFLRDECNWSER